MLFLTSTCPTVFASYDMIKTAVNLILGTSGPHGHYPTNTILLTSSLAGKSGKASVKVSDRSLFFISALPRWGWSARSCPLFTAKAREIHLTYANG